MNSVACVPQNELSLLVSNVSGKIGVSPGGMMVGRTTYDVRRTLPTCDMTTGASRKVVMSFAHVHVVSRKSHKPPGGGEIMVYCCR